MTIQAIKNFQSLDYHIASVIFGIGIEKQRVKWEISTLATSFNLKRPLLQAIL